MMTELLISEVMTAVENHEPVDVGAAAQRCQSCLPDHSETGGQLKDRLQCLALEYGAGVVLPQADEAQKLSPCRHRIADPLVRRMGAAC
ncbi:hypothetical protein [Kaistia terrae]|uniref:Uncharacterized protein n=1 Tax=Kaistia terrae TaxID=537017 RepID=A0ABW0Q1V0_9HYPH|nr:hypothetical protein [Kaistia terrae]MCX5581742.1 hypothetical protein [Kaistia terrae]